MNKYPTSSLILMGIVGFIAAMFFLLAPLHEFWHVLFSLLHGYVPSSVTWTTVTSADTSISMSLAGGFGELISFGAIFVYAVWKEKIYLAAFMIGYMVFNVLILSIPFWIFMPDDFQIAIGHNPEWESMIKFLYVFLGMLNYIWEILAIMTIRALKKHLEQKTVKISHKRVYTRSYTV